MENLDTLEGCFWFDSALRLEKTKDSNDTAEVKVCLRVFK